MSITLPRKAVWSPLIKMATVWYQWMPPFSLLSQPPYQPVLLSTFCHLDGNQGLSEPHHNHQHGDCQPSDLKISLLSSPIWPISPTIRSGCNLPNLSAFLTDLSACQASCTCSSCHPRSDLSSLLDLFLRIRTWILNNPWSTFFLAPHQHHLIQINPGIAWSTFDAPVVQCWNMTMRWTELIHKHFFTASLSFTQAPRSPHYSGSSVKHIHPYPSTGMEWISALYRLCLQQRALTLHQTLHKKRPHFKTDNHTSWILHEGIRNEITGRWRQNYFIIVFFADHNNSWSNSRDLDLQWELRISQCS